jgi:hypothetical protein
MSGTDAKRQLVVLGCSATKVDAAGTLPAVTLYDGPMYRVLRSYLRERRWPTSLSLAVLSAKYGLIGGLSHIETYDQRMTRERAQELADSVTGSLTEVASRHRRIELVLGQDYVRSVDVAALRRCGTTVTVTPGPIGMKLSRFRQLLHSFGEPERPPAELERRGKRALYFLPDWDDFLDLDYDFDTDTFSAPQRAGRREVHSISLMRPRKLCDGVLVSLAQHLGSKGLLKRVGMLQPEAMTPVSVRSHFRLQDNQWAFGDCGAFSYVAEDRPTISVQQAVALYDLYDFDFGASVDHIPVPAIATPRGKVELTKAQQEERVRLTRTNAEAFINLHRRFGAKFIPVGIIQGVNSEDYASQLPVYWSMGYRHIAIGGLVPRKDADVLAVVRGVHAQAKKLGISPWIHLFGIYRPKLQKEFRTLGIDSFDSATYFRKAWLRSDQNYLGTDGTWYAAIRVPPTSDPRTMERLRASGRSDADILRLEKAALDALQGYDAGRIGITDTLTAIAEYDKLLTRGQSLDERLLAAYRHTLERRPWDDCSCRVCQDIGINALIFRGCNRNKRRGAHNTLMLYQSLMTRT